MVDYGAWGGASSSAPFTIMLTPLLAKAASRMRFLFDPIKEQEQKLERFRQSFRILTSDGQYPPERQSRLYQACQKAGLDWDQARQSIRPDALAFLAQMVDQIVHDKRITAEEIAGLRKMQRRLLIGEDDLSPHLERLYTLVEQRLANHIIEYAAYMGEESVMQSLTADIASYDLPPERATRLMTQIERQHQLARMMIGNLPIIATTIALFRDEACHHDESVQVLVQGDLLDGRLVLTSQRILVLAATGGLSADWTQCRAIEMMERSLVLVTTTHTAMILCADSQYVATLLASARRRYVPQAAPTPIRQGKRLG